MGSLPRSTTPFFGRCWSITITPNQGPSAGTPIVISSDAFEPEGLRCTFEINQLAYSAFWQGEIIIYNANGPIGAGPSAGVNLYEAIIQEGDIVTLAAGYQADYPYPQTPPIIWSGPVFYTIQDRLDVVDSRLIVRCLLSRALTTQNFLNETMPALSNQFTQAQFIASKSINPIQVNTASLQAAVANASPQRFAQNLPRGKSFFGNPHNYLASIADQNSLLSWFDSKQWNTASMKGPLGPVVATYAPVGLNGNTPTVQNGIKLSLIGQPQQTQLGVNFRVLLDPTVQVTAPFTQVSLVLRYVRQAPVQYPLPADIGPPLPLASQYVVVGVRFIGDTRGNAWYSDITGCANILSAVALLGQSGQTDPTGN